MARIEYGKSATIEYDTSDYPDIVLRIRGLQHVRSIEFDPINQYIYWIDDQTLSIRKTFEDNNDGEVFGMCKRKDYLSG